MALKNQLIYVRTIHTIRIKNILQVPYLDHQLCPSFRKRPNVRPSSPVFSSQHRRPCAEGFCRHFDSALVDAWWCQTGKTHGKHPAYNGHEPWPIKHPSTISGGHFASHSGTVNHQPQARPFSWALPHLSSHPHSDCSSPKMQKKHRSRMHWTFRTACRKNSWTDSGQPIGKILERYWKDIGNIMNAICGKIYETYWKWLKDDAHGPMARWLTPNLQKLMPRTRKALANAKRWFSSCTCTSCFQTPRILTTPGIS